MQNISSYVSKLLAAVYKQELKCCSSETCNFPVLEALTVRFILLSKTIHVCGVYGAGRHTQYLTTECARTFDIGAKSGIESTCHGYTTLGLALYWLLHPC